MRTFGSTRKAFERTIALSVVFLFLASVIFLAVPAQVRAGLCQPGWVTRSTTYFDFTYGRDAQGRQVWWTGSVLLKEYFDRNCNVVQAELDFTGDSGATLIIAGTNVYASFTVQYPTYFTDYNHVFDNAKGSIVYASPPAGSYSGYNVQINHGAYGDEYKVLSTTSAAKTITGQGVFFSLPTSLVGHTVYAEIHAGPVLKSDWKAILVPT